MAKLTPLSEAAAGTPHEPHALVPGSSHSGFAVGSRTVDPKVNGFDPTVIARDFDWGKTRRLAGGRMLREWELVAHDKEIEIVPGVKFNAWTFNGRVPGPTLRAREGDQLRIHFVNAGTHPHTIHFHGIHRDLMDGAPGIGEEIGGGLIDVGEEFTYEFDARPFGLHLYHCHASPLAGHIAKGLYGAFIVDPAQGRPEADEVLMVQNAFDPNFDEDNEVYAVNTVAFHFHYHPLRVRRGELVRIYLVNIVELDPINSFHIHGNFFHRYPTGTSLEPLEFTDTVIQGQGQRDVLELRFRTRASTCSMPTRASSPRSAQPAAVSVERATLRPGAIVLVLANGSEEAARVAQVIVSDAYVDFRASHRIVKPDDAERITISYPWVQGESYDIELLLSSGEAVAYEVEEAETGSRSAGPA